VIEDYVRWLVGVYTERVGVAPDDPDLVPKAVGVLCRHGSRWPGEDDFVSLVAMEMADRLGAPAAEPSLPFLTMLERVADAVRHRIARAFRKRMAHPPVEMLDQMAAPAAPPEVVLCAIADELIAGLSLEEQTVLKLFLDGVPVDQVARQLNVSLRTVYRRLEEVKRRLSQSGAP
jgi:DNA-binding CsgD family transcriptional regulator